MPTAEELQRLRDEITNAAADKPQPVVAETFLRRWPSYSRPVALRCDDGKEYVVKGQHAGRGIINDQTVARLGIELGAPVGEPQIVEIPAELVAIEPQLKDIRPGTAHGTELVQNCTDRIWPPSDLGLLDNRRRLALLAVLYGWCHANDHQLIYSNVTPRLVYSVDHGHFFPGGPNWTIASLANVAIATLEPGIVGHCGLSEDEQRIATEKLQNMSSQSIVNAVAISPDEWGMSLDERVALASFLILRRDELIATLA